MAVAGGAEVLAAAVCAAYDELPRKGKPSGHEWTVLAGWAVTPVPLSEVSDADEVTVLAMGTGTKCLPPGRMAADGGSLVDAHAEVAAKRALQAALIDALSGEGVVELVPIPGAAASDPGAPLVELGPQQYVHLYVSQTPCGDASIFVTDAASAVSYAPASKRKAFKGLDMQRTGARAVGGASGDAKEPGTGYHTPGLLRTKPGRGEPSQSMSCSDKIARWVALGMQGTLLGSLVAPIRLSSIVVGELFDRQALERALVTRVAALLPPGVAVPVVAAAPAATFAASRAALTTVGGYDADELTTTGASVVAWRRRERAATGSRWSSHAVLGARGRLLGTTKAKAKNLSSASPVSPALMLARFVAALESVFPERAAVLAAKAGVESVYEVPYKAEVGA
ncbi:tRNA-specific adenosine deaminase 1 [Thecamonas trahens ATCC 50062]|uniref:tRNA-specific adenosine deaminase 1 n=1 Tax=Thecamonas trahens ATCC 50062 TaxID=461836 RepID=A0A0L0D2L6_THETB|nr:tRNA-specific adenosine deaminase 1 [Thecamonas trahens ATCC 50062]KNC46557.1 tRNA-specific adenosine deaminase 1 [Thecamonas trahens ATCC 50062]|eukprot:XP_013760336.1 tRNA-specific adenosine deaminase 1 [Thecamonas trahens ATCC 50062]